MERGEGFIESSKFRAMYKLIIGNKYVCTLPLKFLWESKGSKYLVSFSVKIRVHVETCGDGSIATSDGF